MAGVDRVFEVLDRDPIIKDAPDAILLPRRPRTLTMDHVAFAYRESASVLEDITVEIKPGQMVAFVGSSGVGKTTLLNLFPRFYDPTGGALKLDGHDLRKIKLKSLRAHIALVLQESVILPTSIAENIAYGRPKATDAQIRKAAELAGAAAFIDKLPEGYDTQVAKAAPTSPAASGSASASPAPCSPRPPSSSWTSPPAPSTPSTSSSSPKPSAPQGPAHDHHRQPPPLHRRRLRPHLRHGRRQHHRDAAPTPSSSRRKAPTTAWPGTR